MAGGIIVFLTFTCWHLGVCGLYLPHYAHFSMKSESLQLQCYFSPTVQQSGRGVLGIFYTVLRLVITSFSNPTLGEPDV